mgnify:CR=1 FL=1
MADHKTLANSELHEPKGMSTLTGGAADVGKVAVSLGDGTSEVRKLQTTDLSDLGSILALTGTFYDAAVPTGAVDVATEGKTNYLVGVVTTQNVTVDLPNPASYTESRITVKRLDANHGDGSTLTIEPFGAETIEGAANLALTIQNVSLTLVTDGINWFIAEDYYAQKALHGLWDYNDLATQTTPLNAVAATPLALTNDGAGPFTNLAYKPDGFGDIWDMGVGQDFDWTELSLGDTVDLRVDIEITTTSVNQVVDIYLELGQGASPYQILFDTTLLKSVTTKQLVSFSSIYMGDANTLNNPAQFFVLTDANATVKVNGWYVRVNGSKDTF